MLFFFFFLSSFKKRIQADLPFCQYKMSSCQEAELNTVTYHAHNKYEQRREGMVNHLDHETGVAQASWIPT